MRYDKRMPVHKVAKTLNLQSYICPHLNGHASVYVVAVLMDVTECTLIPCRTLVRHSIVE